MKLSGRSLVLSTIFFGSALFSGCGGGSIATIVASPAATTTNITSAGSTFANGASVVLTATVSPSAATGTVTFFDGTTTLGTGTLTAGVATFSTTTLSIGTHSLTASYGGSASNYAASTSATLLITVASTPTTTTLAVSSASAVFGTAVTFTAAVSPAVALGTVTFFDGTTMLGTGTVNGGVATFSTTTLSLGTHSITASYGGSGSTYAASTSALLSITIVAATATATTLTVSSASTVFGSAVTLTATVSPAAATGVVTFSDGTTVLGTGMLAAGVASFSTTSLAVGTHSITATYGGVTLYAGSTSMAKGVIITAIPTMTVLSTSANTTTPTNSITLTATLSPSSATGTVTFADGATTLGSATVNSGVAMLPVSNLAVGSHVITASFTATGNYGSSVSNALTITGTAIPTTLMLGSNAATATAGTNVTFTATINPGAASGAVTFMEGATNLGSGTLGGGVAILTTSTLAAGEHFVTASYPGNAVYVASASNSLAVTINKASTPPITGTFAGPSITGKVMAGAQPVSGASVQFYAAGTTGYGIAAGNLIASPITTDASGSFTIPASYSCPLATTQVYLVATGGVTSSAVSAPFEFLSALGSCNALPTTVVVNEVTTVAAAWSLAQFLGAGGSIGTNQTNGMGLANAFRIAESLASTTTGISPGASFPANASSPAAKINALANLMNTCATSSSVCQQFFTATGAGPSNTLDAARAVVLHPAANAAALYTLAGKSTAYTPVPSTAPADWVLFTVISGASLSGTSGVGVLSTGNVWASNYNGAAVQLTPLGGPAIADVSGYGLSASYGLAVDLTDNAWIPNDAANGSVTKISADGTTGANFSGSGIYFPVYTAIDSDNSVWVADYGNSTLTHLSNAGAPVGAGAYSIPQISFPTALAIDANHNVWTNDQTGFTVTRIAPDGTNPIVVTCCNGPTGFAIDQRGFVWVTNYYDGGSLSELSSTGTVIASSLKGGGIANAQAIAVDGAGNLWVANFQAKGISEFAGSQSTTPGTPLSPSVGFAPDGPIPGGFSIAVDASGNVWMANFNSGNVIRYLGVAAPTKAPFIGPAQAP